MILESMKGRENRKENRKGHYNPKPGSRYAADGNAGATSSDEGEATMAARAKIAKSCGEF